MTRQNRQQAIGREEGNPVVQVLVAALFLSLAVIACAWIDADDPHAPTKSLEVHHYEPYYQYNQ